MMIDMDHVSGLIRAAVEAKILPVPQSGGGRCRPEGAE